MGLSSSRGGQPAQPGQPQTFQHGPGGFGHMLMAAIPSMMHDPNSPLHPQGPGIQQPSAPMAPAQTLAQRISGYPATPSYLAPQQPGYFGQMFRGGRY